MPEPQQSQAPLPIPARVHYELLLQLLERQTLPATESSPELWQQVQALVTTLRKALAQQKELEASCDAARLPYESRWSLNSRPGQERKS
ncbi:MAG: hypothetical protein BRC58_03920 [Cyanobacteria bacterium QS_8_64_29]|nr:MAG: hypothetical protein BRC58_03920 [Cyanobacteria bacterium QS_8_64_29]